MFSSQNSKGHYHERSYTVNAEGGKIIFLRNSYFCLVTINEAQVNNALSLLMKPKLIMSKIHNNLLPADCIKRR